MILIDYNAVAIRGVLAQSTAIDENTIRHTILNSLRLYRNKFKMQYGELVICSDGQSNWRYNVFPHYKFKRKSSRKESNIDWKELFRITNMVLQELKESFPYKVLEHENCEADDIIAALCEDTQQFGRHQDVLIISSDKDFGQLQKWNNIYQFSPMTKKFIKEDAPRKQLLELILKGDQADGIPNILSSDNCFVDGIRQTPLRQKKIDEIVNSGQMSDDIKKNFLRNKKLIDLSETPDSYKEEIINSYEQQAPVKNYNEVMNYLMKNRCRLLLENVEEFI